ncbi:flagellar motor switch protein FliN [Vogesella sp. LIG4]|uniref:flagellar motor switch protein FliN n=1 Tax=Vogesella sp. LIG4 TaxID=1192162 RepID=UPI00081F819A|nr:flagellar motor switch protein FliN [Vogesella sp. LIG4]SCK17467.1 flagellar motor switch protein FliN/FliY [Vogesella sp. LIG4]
MEPTDAFDIDAMLADTAEPAVTEAADSAPRRDNLQMLRKIPVTLTLEVGSAKVSLLELMGIGPGSVVELDRLAGEPLLIKVNGTTVGKAEVVVAGDNYGLKVVELAALDLDTLQP